MFLRKRGNKWYYRISVIDYNGERKLISRVGGRTKAEAEKAGRKALSASMDEYGFWEEPEKMSFAQYLDIFIAEYVEINLRPATINSYKGTIKNHIKPAIGDIPLQKLTPRALQNFLNGKRKELSRSSLCVIKNILSKSLSYAVETCGFINHNAAAHLTIPPIDRAPQKTHVFTDDEIARIFQSFPKEHKFHLPISLSYYTGMRLGECLSLKWEDIDLEGKTIYIHTTMFDDGGAGIVQDLPKTQSSIRTIPIGTKLVQELLDMQAYQEEQRIAYGKYWRGTGFVCIQENGKNLTASRMRYFAQWCKEKLGKGSFHSIRHTHATKLLESGLDLELVSKRLGHSTIVLTARTYSHVLENRDRKTRSLIDQIF